MERRRIVVLAGQSNMVGSGARPEEIPDSVRRRIPSLRIFEEGSWHDLIWGERFGPEVGFALSFPETAGSTIEFCKVARGATNLFYDWNPDGISRGSEDVYRGPLFPRLTEAISAIRESSGGSTSIEFVGFLWMQGERDSVFREMAAAYRYRLTELVARVREVTAAPRLPVVIAGVSPRKYEIEALRFKHPFRHVVREAQREVAAADPNAAYVETDDLPQSDNLHFDTAGQIELGRRCAAALVSIG